MKRLAPDRQAKVQTFIDGLPFLERHHICRVLNKPEGQTGGTGGDLAGNLAYFAWLIDAAYTRLTTVRRSDLIGE